MLSVSRSRDEAGARSNTYVAGRRCLATLHAGVGIAQLTTLGVNYERHHHTSRFQSGTKLVAHAAARHSSHRIRGSDIRVAGNIPGFAGAAVRRLLYGGRHFTVWTAVSSSKDHEYWWLLLLEGLLGIGIGVLTLFAPAVTALALLFYIALWAIATGVLEIAAAIRLRKEIQGEWLLLLAGLASVVFGVLLIWQPGAGALTVLWLIGSYAIVFGVLLLILALKIRGFVAKIT